MTELEALQARHSERKYLDKPIEAEKIAAIQKCVELCNRAHLDLGIFFQ